MNIFDEHYKGLRSVLETGEGASKGAGWKVLIVDDETLRQISYYKVGDLREMNVALHLHLHEEKEELHGVTAIYFISPSARSLEALLADSSANLFDEMWVHFAGPVKRAELQEFCTATMQRGRTGTIKGIRQCWFPLLPLQENCFTLRTGGTAAVAKALIGVCCNARAQPIFAFPQRSDLCRSIATAVQAALAATSDYFLPPEMRAGQLLIFLYDSAADLLPNLVHSFGYAQTVSDYFGLWGEEAAGEAPGQIDLRNDRFFSRNFFAELPAAALDLEAELNLYRERFAALETSAEGGPDRTAESLSEKLDSLPEMTELRKRNKLHLGLCDALMKDAAARSYDRYALVSLAAFRQRVLNSEQQAEATALLRDPAGLATDKLRLFAVIAATEACSAKELAAWAELVVGSTLLTAPQKAFLRKTGTALPAAGGYLSAFADSGKRMLQARLGSGATASSARALLELFRRREPPEGLVLWPEAAPLAAVKEVVCLNLVGGSFVELADLLDAGKQLGRRVRLGIAALLPPAAALARYLELSAP